MLPYLFVIFAVLARMPFMPHPWNFAPVAAALLYFGARGSRRQLWIPFALLAASDIVLDKFVYAYPFSLDQLASWAWYALALWLGTNLRANTDLQTAKDWLRVGGAALTSSVSFYVMSNLAVWFFGTMYPKTVAGLMTCYAAGLPFFRHTCEGDLLYTALMFGAPVLAASLARSSKPRGTAAV
jgi:hypothetical protein